MARFCGVVGFGYEEETAPGVWVNKFVERTYRGDIVRNTKRWENGKSINDDLTIDNRISIVADAFAYEKVFAMKYVRWMGTDWKIRNVEIQRPRLLLTLGGVYNRPSN